MGVIELEAIQVEFNGTPGVRFQQISKIINQLLPGEIIDFMIKIVANAADGTRVGLNGLGTESFELEVLQMLFVIYLEFSL